jgi:2-methylcitrate dehydratase MmgE/PrpD-like protein
MIGTPQSDSPSNAHAASNVVPAIMAIAERDDLDDKAFLAALILGGEVGGRIERASMDVETKRGFHNPAVQERSAPRRQSASCFAWTKMPSSRHSASPAPVRPGCGNVRSRAET